MHLHIGAAEDIAMSNIAVIKTGGKQYLVHEGQVMNIEKLDLEIGSNLEFDALMVSDTEGEATTVGTPIVEGAKVTVTVVDHGRDDKVHVIKYKRKSRYRRNVGHRQPFTKVKIEKIIA